MQNYVVNRPEEAVMRRILEEHRESVEGVILRLAWLQGLLREEIVSLRWDQVSFLNHAIELPDRSVPFEEEMEDYLTARRAQWERVSEMVVFSVRYKKPMQAQSLSRIVRRILDEAGQTEVRLIDLRHDYIIRQLQTHDWPYVARVSGVEVRALQLHFSSYLPDRTPERSEKTSTYREIDEFRLWKLMQSGKDTPAGLALWLTWQLRMTGQEIVNLRWEQVDLEQGVIRLDDRELFLTNAITQMLQSRLSDREWDDHVLLSQEAKRPLDLPRLSRITRAALISGGLEQVTLRDIRYRQEELQLEQMILDQTRAQGVISRREVMELCGLTETAAYNRLRQLTEQKKLMRIGSKYYLWGVAIPPERQEEVIQAYLEQEGFAYRRDIARALCIQDKQCSLILKRMVDEGKLVQVNRRYMRKEA